MLRLRDCESCCEEQMAVDHVHATKLLSLKEDDSDDIRELMRAFSDFPTKLSQACEHTSSLCKTCTATHISTQVADNNITHIQCPQVECQHTLGYEEIKSLASEETFQLQVYATDFPAIWN